MKTNHSVWWSITGNTCLCLITVVKLSMLKLMSTVKTRVLAHRGQSGNYSLYWPWEDPSWRDTPFFLWHSSHMFPIWSTKPPFYVWNGAEHNSALDGMWSMETRPDGTPSDGLSGQSQTLLTETPANWRQPALLHFPICLLGFPACHDAAVVDSAYMWT